MFRMLLAVIVIVASWALPLAARTPLHRSPARTTTVFLQPNDPCLTPAYARRCADDHASMETAESTAAPMAVQTGLPDVIPLHQYPYGKTQYDSRTEWLTRFWSSQGHWLINGMLAHLHVECGGPIYGRIAHALAFTLPCRAQAFHLPGRVDLGYGNKSQWTWDVPGDHRGNPMGLEIFNASAVFDPSAFDGRPENGWFTAVTALFAIFDNGPIQNVELHLPFYAVGDPAVPASVDPGVPLFSARTMMFPATPPWAGQGHGQAIVECRDYLPVLAPVTTTITVTDCWSYVYTRDRGPWPAPELDGQSQLDEIDLHNLIPGIPVTQRFGVDQLGPFPVIFNPFTKAGPRKTAVTWKQNSGPGDPAQGIHPNEELWALLVFPWTAAPGGTPPPPPPPPPPAAVDCVLTKTPMLLSPGVWIITYVETRSPANGGKSCAVVAGGG